MRAPVTPLSEAESKELESLLKASGGQSLWFARGIFAAVATAPVEQEPTQWLSLILGAETEDRSTLKTAFGLLLREYNACADCLALDVPAVPVASDTKSVVAFAKGYVQIAQRDKRWPLVEGAFDATLPLAFAAGYVDYSGLIQSGEPQTSSEDEERTQIAEQLAAHVATLYKQLADAREAARKEKAQQEAASSDKVGRNDPCPCGSGKKYKKCCGAG